jgi:hypothetical protein
MKPIIEGGSDEGQGARGKRHRKPWVTPCVILSEVETTETGFISVSKDSTNPGVGSAS